MKLTPQQRKQVAGVFGDHGHGVVVAVRQLADDCHRDGLALLASGNEAAAVGKFRDELAATGLLDAMTRVAERDRADKTHEGDVQ